MLNIRKFTAEDVEQVTALEQSCFSMPWKSEDFLRLAGDPDSLYLVAEDDGKIVGICGVTNIVGEGNINNVAVNEAYRGQGIATKLMTRLIEEGYAMGIAEFTLEVRVSNAPAISVYEKCGFVSEGVRPKFYEKPVEDALIMWKRS